MERGPRLRVVEGPYPVEEVGGLSHAQTTPNPSHVQLPKPSIPSAAADSTTTAEAEGWQTLVVVNELHVVPKEVRPIDNQHPFESRRLWRNATGNSLTRSFLMRRRRLGRRRDDAAERKKGFEFIPTFFENGLEDDY